MMAKNEEIILHLAFFSFPIIYRPQRDKTCRHGFGPSKAITSLLTTQSDQGVCYFSYLIAYLNLLQLKF